MDSSTATIVGVLIGSMFSVFSSFLSGWFLHSATRKEKRRDNLREDMVVKRKKIESLALEEERLNRMVVDLEYDILHQVTPEIEKHIKEITGEAYKIYAVVPLYFTELAPVVSNYNELLVRTMNALGRYTRSQEQVRTILLQEYRHINEQRKNQYAILRGQFRHEMEVIEQTLQKL